MPTHPESPGHQGPGQEETPPAPSPPVSAEEPRGGRDEDPPGQAERPPAARKAGKVFARSMVKAKEAMASPAVRSMGKKAASAAVSRYSPSATGHAAKMLRNKDKLLSLARRGDDVVGDMDSGAMSGVSDEVRTLLRLIRAYATGEYRDVPFETMVPIVAAVIYVVSPIDLIPEFIPGVGGLDDLTVVTYALRLVRDQLDKFVAWERETGRHPHPPPALDAGPTGD